MDGSNKSRKMIIVLGVVIVLLALALVVCVLLLWQSRNVHTPVRRLCRMRQQVLRRIVQMRLN